MKDTNRAFRVLLASAGLALTSLLATSGPAAAQNKSVTVVLTEELSDFDICNAMRSNIGESLTKIDPKDGSVTPLPAASWELVNDRTWRFHLRGGVKFPDGAPCNVEAVVKTINRTYHSPDLFCENNRKSGLKQITGTLVDEYTVDMALDKPAPILPVRMGVMSITSPNEPMHKIQVKKAIGTGPYKFESFTTGTAIVLARNEDYWGPKPVVERTRFVFRKESSVRATLGPASMLGNDRPAP